MTPVRTDRTEATLEQRMLNGSVAPDFLESAHEWRRLFAETWGTFLLVVVAAGAVVVGAQSGGAISLSMKVVAPGLMVMAINLFHGRGQRRPFKSSGHLGFRHTAQFSLVPSAGLYRGADHWGHCRSVFPQGDVRHGRINRRHHARE